MPVPTQLSYSTLSELAKSVAAPLPLVAYPPLGSRQMLSPEVRLFMLSYFVFHSSTSHVFVRFFFWIPTLLFDGLSEEMCVRTR